MILSKKHKYLFVALPSSASTSISVELVRRYDGHTILQKHSNIPTLLQKTDIDLKDYFVFGVYRNPLDITYSKFIKLKFDEHNVFNNPRYIEENGGHLGRKKREFRNRMVNEDWSYEDYVRYLSKSFKPYENSFTINKKYLSFVIKFKNLSSDFDTALKRIGIKPIRNLPVYNKTTSKVKPRPKISEELVAGYFGPFLQENAEFHNGEMPIKPKILSNSLYKTLKPIRKTTALVKDLYRNRKWSK